MRDVILVAGAAIFGFAVASFFMMPDHGTAMVATAMASFGQNCSIKGNVSIDSGERIYHMPGQTYYAGTTIRPEFGERWFCTENEARLAGWRKSRV